MPSISDNAVKFGNIKHLTIHTQKARKFYFSYHIWHFMCYFGLTCSQDHCLFDWTRCVVSLPFVFSNTIYSGNINSWRSYYWIIFMLVRLDLFSADLIAFAINDFHEQIHAKDSLCLVEAAIWKITVCLIYRKQSEYFDKRVTARFLTWCIYNGAFYGNSLRLDPTNRYYKKELLRRLSRVPEV